MENKTETRWSTIKEFAEWYKQNNFPIRPPSDLFVYETDVALSTVVFREGLFQVEMYFAKPNMVAIPHAHNADQITIHLGGTYEASKGWGTITMGPALIGDPKNNNENPDLPNKDFGQIGDTLMAGWWHSLSSGPRGFVFFVCQKWNTKEDMYSTFTDWVGEPLGKVHESMMNSKGWKTK